MASLVYESGTRLSALEDIRDYDPLKVDESAIIAARGGSRFDSSRHPRGRGGKWVNVLGKMVHVKKGEINRGSPHEAYISDHLPDIAGSSMQISTHAHVPVNVRLSYQQARSETLAAAGTSNFESKAKAAHAALHKVRNWPRQKRISEAISEFEPALHPRGRKGKFVDVLGRIVHVPGKQMQIHVTERPGAYSKPEDAEFARGARVVLPDGRTGTVAYTGTSGHGEYRRIGTGNAARYEHNYREPKYAVLVDKEGETPQPDLERRYYHGSPGIEHVEHSKLRYAPEEMADRTARAEGIAAKAAKGGKPLSAFKPVQHPVTLNAGVVPGDWQVAHGYGEWANPAHRNPSEGDRVRVMPTHPEYAGMVGTVHQSRSPEISPGVVRGGAVGPGTQVQPMVWLDGKPEPVPIKAHEFLMPESQQPWIRQKPGTDVEKMIFHYLSGRTAPANPTPGTPAWEQWTYGMTGVKGGTKLPGNKAARADLIRKITQAALAARDAGDLDGWADLLAEACIARTALDAGATDFDPLWVEEAREFAVHFDPSLHPRDRKGEFARVLSGLSRKTEVALPGGITVRRSVIGGYRVDGRGGSAMHFSDPHVTANHALSLHDNVSRPSFYRQMSKQEADSLGLFSPGGASRREDASSFNSETERLLNQRASARAALTGEQSSRSKAQALVDSGLAEDLADARAQLADMGEGGGRSSPGGSGARLHDLSAGDEFHWQGVRYRHEGANEHGADRVNATKLHGGETHVLPADTLVDPVAAGSTIAARGRDGNMVVVAQTRRVNLA